MDAPPQQSRGFDRLYGLQITELTDDRVRGRVVVRDDLKQPHGPVHGGVYAALAESLASIGTTLAVARDGRIAVGLCNHTNFLRPITTGTIDAVAVRKHKGRTTWVWEVEMADEHERVCVVSRMTMAVRER